MNSKYKGRIVYTAMHGVGADYIDKAFEIAGFQPVIHVKEQRGRYNCQNVYLDYLIHG